MSGQIERILCTFGIDAHVTGASRGPAVTRFEVNAESGTDAARIVRQIDDIESALRKGDVRVEAPPRGKTRVGIEVPNEERDSVVLRELLECSAFRDGQPAQLNLALGKGTDGGACVADLARMPHLLMAGTPGTGQTVCIKSLLASLLVQHTPANLQLMLMALNKVELTAFNDIPHLLAPVVTDAKKAVTMLSWLVAEMEKRYRLLANLRTRNIELYNKGVENGTAGIRGEDSGCSAPGCTLPYIVCFIDELAAMMMSARIGVEDHIARLAQLSRAVGIHLIIATQHPSVDVLTGIIKANFPARISFRASSRVGSRCILDEAGAERLIGMGDMLYLAAGQNKLSRLQGPFVGDGEINALITFLKRQAPPRYCV